MKRKSPYALWRLLFSIILFLFVTNVSFAQSHVDVNLSTQQALPPDWLGYTCPNINKGQSLVTPNYVSHIPLLLPKVVRYPGNSSWFDWKRGWYSTSPLVPTKLSGMTQQPNYLENFKIVLDSCHAKAMFTLNMVTATLQDQIAMLKHADSIGIPVKYVELGNEIYAASGSPDAPEGSDVVDSIYPDGHSYAIACNKWIDTIHHYFPNAKVSICGNFEKLSSGREGIWNDSVKKYINGREDAWTYHVYVKTNPGDSAVNETMDDIRVWMSRPDWALNVLNLSMAKRTPGKEAWITEYNNDDFYRPTVGRWAHGLYMGSITLKYLENSYITNLTAHAVSGSAIYGQFFDDDLGFSISEAGLLHDSTYAHYDNPPPTTPWGLSASGRIMQMISQAANGKTYTSRLSFSPNHKISISTSDGNQIFDGIYGRTFVGSTGSTSIILNVSDSAYVLNTTTLFPTGSSYKLISGDPLGLIATDADVNTTTGTLGSSLTLPAYSAVKIMSSFVPSGASTVTLTVNGSTSICAGDSVKLDAGAGFAYYLWNTGATTRTIWVKTTGDYSVAATNSLTSYWGGSSVHITVNPLPLTTNLTLITGPHSFCLGTDTTILHPTTVYPAGTQYLWNSGETTMDKSVITTGGNFFLTVIDANGCKTVSETENVTVYPLPQPAITVTGPTQFCSTTNSLLIATPGFVTYTWSNLQHGDTLSVSASGTYTVSAKDGNGCWGNSTNSVPITVWSPPVPTITVNGPSSFCSGAPTYLSTTTGYACQWSNSNGDLAGATSATYSPASGGTYKVMLTDIHGCTQKSAGTSITVWNNPAPSINVAGGTSICQGQSTLLSSSNTGYLSYLWSTGSTATSINVSTTGTYSLTVTDGNGCVGSAVPKVITVNPLPTPSISAGGPTEFCNGSNVVLTANQNYSTVSWSSGGFGQSKTISASGTYYCTVTDVNGCQNVSNSIAVNVHTLPTPAINTNTGSLTFCSNAGVYLTTTTTGYSYQWFKGATTLTGATSQNYSATSTGTYKLKINDAMGCTASSNALAVTVNAPPAPSINGPATICNGTSTALSANTTYTTYLWSTGGTTQSINVTTAGTYTLTVTNTNACTGTASITLQGGSATMPVLSASGPTDFCNGGSIVISTVPATYSSYAWSNTKTTSTITVSSSGGYSCTVTDANGCTATSAVMNVNVHTLPIPVVTTSNGQVTFCDNSGVYMTNDAVGYNYQWYKGANIVTGETNKNLLNPSSGSYKVQITDNIGCSSTGALLAVTVNAHPTPDISGASFICGSNPVSLSTTSTYMTYLWSNGGTAQSTTVSSAGTYSVTVTDVNSCSGTTSTTLQAGSATVPVLSASGATDFCSGGSIVISTIPATYSSYAWSNSKTTSTISVNSTGGYSCTVTDANGCTATSALMNVNVHSLPVPNVLTSTGATTWCTSEAVYLTTDAVGYNYQWYRAATAQNGATNQNYTPTVTGSYKVKITDNIGCTSMSSLLSITISSSLLPTIVGTPVICNGTATVLSANTTYSTYLWSTGATTQSISVNTTGTYSLTVTNASGCSGTTSVTVTSGSITTPTISASGATEFCSGGSVTLSITPTTYSSYLWSNGSTTASISVNSSGTYSCTVTNSNGCSKVSSSITVNVHSVATPTVTTSTGQTTYCSNAGVYLTTSSVGYNYQWYKGTAAQTGATNQNYAPAAGGNYKVKITDNIGCNATSAAFTVTINSAPAPGIAGVTTVCGGNPIVISADQAYATYLWSTGATTQTISVSTAGTYSLTVSNTNGCTGSTSAAVQSGSATVPVLSASGPTEFCNGGSVTLSTTPANYTSYLWSNTKTTSTISVTATGSYSCTVTNAAGCTATSLPISVNVHTLPTPVVTTSSGSTTFCDNAGVYLTTSTVGYSYQWLKGTIVQTGATNQNFTPPAGGNYKVQITDNIGCSATSNTLTITINTATVPGITGGGTICGGSSTTLSADNIYSSYLWSTGATTQSITVNTAGSYSLTITNTSGCTGSATKTVTTGSATVPVINASGPTEFCSGSNVILSTSPATYISYLWSNTKTTSTITVNASGNYSCTVTDASGCTAISAAKVVNVHSVPTPTVTSSTGQTTFCANAGVYLTTSSVGYNYQWIKGAAAQTGATNQNYTPTATSSYKVKITDNIGCSATSSAFSVTVNVAPAPTITGVSNICSGSSVAISANTSYNSYLWSTGATTQSINVSSAGTYTLTVTNAGGCSGTTSKTMTISTPPTATITASGATSFCDGGTVTLTANPTSSSYLWSDGKTSQTDVVTATGTFTVTVTDANGCTGTSTATSVTEWAVPSTAVTVNGPTTFCADVTPCTLVGPSGYSYQWKKGTIIIDGATNKNYVPTSSATYKLTTTDTHGCSATTGTGVTITVNSLPNASISTSGNLTICPPQTKTLNANAGNGLVFQWRNAGVDIFAATNVSYTALAAGSFSCFETNSTTGCTALSNTLVITPSCKEDNSDQTQLPSVSTVQLYPNPTSGAIHVEAEFAGQNDGEAWIEIRDMVSALVYSEKTGVTSGKMEKNIEFGESFPSGVYFMRIRMNDDYLIKRFVIVNKEK